MNPRDIDVSDLPTYDFGPVSLSWWGTILLVVIESFMLALCVAAYFYLRTVVPDWPPPTPYPDLLVPTVVTALFLFACIPNLRLDLAARREDVAATKRGLVYMSIAGILLTIARAFEFQALNTRWDMHAYGSIVWTLLCLHTFHLVGETIETLAMTALVFTERIEGKYLVDASDSCIFWYFVIGAWLLVYAVVYWAPRIL